MRSVSIGLFATYCSTVANELHLIATSLQKKKQTLPVFRNGLCGFGRCTSGLHQHADDDEQFAEQVREHDREVLVEDEVLVLL